MALCLSNFLLATEKSEPKNFFHTHTFQEKSDSFRRGSCGKNIINYQNLFIFQFINPLSFAGVVYPYVTFESKWSIEKNYDFVQFQISTDGISWHPLSGDYTTIGSGQTAQPSSEPGYDGYQEDWVSVLSQYLSLDSFQ